MVPDAAAPRRVRRLLGSSVVGAALLLGACSTGSVPGDAAVSSRPAGPSAVSAEALCTEVVARSVATSVDGLTEASGLVASRAHPGVLWTHEDAGSGPELFPLSPTGSDLGRVTVRGAAAVDWEDIALLPGRDGAPDRLVLGDIGDNPGADVRETTPVQVVVVDEPAPGGDPSARAATEVVASVEVVYEDGSRDAESLLADPLTGDVLIVSKQWDLAPAGVYRVPAAALEPGSGTVRVEAERVATVGGSLAALFTSGDVSPDGLLVALRTYTDVRLWDRAPDESVGEALARPAACRIPVSEPQGEAVAFTVDGRGLVTLSEGRGAPLLVHHLP